MLAFDAEIPEIVRSQKKDDECIDYLRKSVQHLAQGVLNARQYALWQREFSLATQLLYYATTTLSGLQTLGEEYVGLIQVVPSANTSNGRPEVPSIFRRFIFIVFQVCGPYFLDKSLSKLRSRLSCNFDQNRPIPSYLPTLLRLLDVIKSSGFSNFQKLHLAIFYVAGRYYHFSRRLTGVRYVSIRPQSHDSILGIFRWLGYLATLQIFVSAILWLSAEIFSRRRATNLFSEIQGENLKEKIQFSTQRCPLCLDEGKPFACTPCGHAFCWDCLVEQTTSNGHCPICRYNVEPCRVVPLMNL